MNHSQHNAETPAPANHLSAGRGVISPSPSATLREPSPLRPLRLCESVSSPSALPPASCPLPTANCQLLPPPPDPDSPYPFVNGLRNALAIEAVAALIIYAIWRVLK